MAQERHITPVVLSGGSGTRLWPMSRSLYPKQLLPLVDPERTMLQATVLRSHRSPDLFAAPIVVANEEHRFVIAEQLRAIGCSPQAIILEPEGRNTAPAAALAALFIANGNPDGLMLLMPSDHAIHNTNAFQKAVRLARDAAAHGQLVTFGIKPDKPETGYGYIQQGDGLPGVAGAHRVKRFVEKPNLATAEEYLQSGEYLWNSGIFLFPVRQFIEELGQYEPDMLAACRQAVAGCAADLWFQRPDAVAFRACPSNSVDYAVMERTRNATVIPVDMQWSDVGSWAALWEIGAKDENGNVAQGDVLAVDTRNSLLRSSGIALATVGVDDLVVVALKDVVLVTTKDHSQDVKKVVDQLKAQQRTEHIAHTVSYRPWGSFDVTDHGDRYQVRRLVMKPGQAQSMQRHHHRAQHWIVVKGVAKVTRQRDDGTVLSVQHLGENQSCYIPSGEIHKLENPGKIDLCLVEVHSGSYLADDAIERFDNHYDAKERSPVAGDAARHARLTLAQ